MDSSRSPPPGFHQYSPPTLTHQPSSAVSYGPQAMQQLLANQYAGSQSGGAMGPNDVGDDEYNRLLKNYKLAHLRIEEQRMQMLEQEKQNALLRKHIGLLQGAETSAASVIGTHAGGGGGTTVDDFTIKNSSSSLERRINRWAADTLSAHARSVPSPPPGTAHLALVPLAEALFADIEHCEHSPFLTGLQRANFDYVGLGIVVQSLLRHVMSQLLSEGIVNELLVTNSEEANRELTKLHEQLFNREPLVASVWRRQTFSAAVESLDPTMSFSLFAEHMPALFALINPHPQALEQPLAEVLEASYTFSRMLHASRSAAGGGAMESGGFYRAYVPEIGSQLDPTKLELIKKCYRTERGEPERVGACLFPGLVKESAVDSTPVDQQQNAGHGNNQRQKRRETRPVVVRRAQVICECALAAAQGAAGPQRVGSS